LFYIFQDEKGFRIKKPTKSMNSWERGCPHPHRRQSGENIVNFRAIALIADVDIRAPSKAFFYKKILSD